MVIRWLYWFGCRIDLVIVREVVLILSVFFFLLVVVFTLGRGSFYIVIGFGAWFLMISFIFGVLGFVVFLVVFSISLKSVILLLVI